MTDNQESDQDQQITSIADAVVKLKEIRESNKNLNEPDIEEKFARLSLCFKTDKMTLGKRLDLQLRQRDNAEKNIEGELRALRESLNALNQLCTESDMRDLITKTQQHVDIVQHATMRMSSRAETYGAIQQEQRMNCAFETMLNYVEHLKLLYDKEHLELEEYRRLLAEHNLLPDEKSAMEEDAKRILPPRSQSLSCTPRPETKTRLLSTVCLLNNNSESSPTFSSKQPGSPKSRRSSLPVVAQPATHHTKTLATTNEKQESKAGRKESLSKTLSRTESEESSKSREAESEEKPEDVEEDVKDSSDVSFVKPPEDNPSPIRRQSSSQESACDKDVCLLPELIVPVKSKSLFLLHLIRKATSSRVWKLDSATLLLHARYALSAVLATAAMFTLVMTFVPS